MELLKLIGLPHLMDRTGGSENIGIGLIDGPVYINHALLNKKNIVELPGHLPGMCYEAHNNNFACLHGTYIAGILKGERSSAAPSICPECTLLIRSVFAEFSDKKNAVPSSTPKHVANAILSCINAGARVINLSLAIAYLGLGGERELDDVFAYAAKKGVIIIVAAGNQGSIGSTAIIRHSWIIPVVACNQYGVPIKSSNLGNSIGKRGLKAPGENIISLNSAGDYTSFSGTSAAAPFITGIVALLWSLFPNASAGVIRTALLGRNNRNSILPPLANAIAAYHYVNTIHKNKIVA